MNYYEIKFARSSTSQQDSLSSGYTSSNTNFLEIWKTAYTMEILSEKDFLDLTSIFIYHAAEMQEMIQKIKRHRSNSRLVFCCRGATNLFHCKEAD